MSLGKRALRIGLPVAFTVVIATLVLGSAEEAMLFPAPSAPATDPVLADGAPRAWIETGQGGIEAFLLPVRRDAPGPLLVYAHGNGELVDFWLDVGYGRSLGGGAVAALAKVRRLAALILESTFTSVGDVAHDAFGVPASLVRNAFDNLAVVRGYTAPVLVIHGEQDGSIPVAHARHLAEAAPDAELEILPCGHNDCPRPWDRIERFLSARELL